MRFAETGANIIAVDVDGEGLQRLTREIPGVRVQVKLVDLSNKSEIDMLWEEIDNPQYLGEQRWDIPVQEIHRDREGFSTG